MRHSKLKTSQDSRRARILEATFALAREGGYDAVQLRAVSQRSNVALGTIYRYFTSRDHLIAAAITRRPVPQVHVESREPKSLAEVNAWLKHAYRWLLEPYEHEPNLLEALVRASASRTPEVSATLAAQGIAFWGQLEKIFPEDQSAYAADVVMILRNVWFASINDWVNGVLPVTEIYPQIERTIDRLIPPDRLAGGSSPAPMAENG